MNNEHVLKINNLNVWYNQKLHALKNISLNITPNKVTAFIGASGSGKSTFLRSINRMLDTIPGTKIEGQVLYKNNDIYNEGADVIKLRQNIGMVFQHPTPFPKSIYENVAYGLRIENKAKKEPFNWKKVFEKKDYKDVENSDDPIDIAVVKSLKEAALWSEVKERLHESALRLSGGQQQRLCIARAVAIKPSVILLDEPTSELDPIATKKIEDLILKLRENYTVVMVTHSMQQARRISDKVAFFHLGKLVEFGDTDKIFNNADNALTNSYVRGEFG